MRAEQLEERAQVLLMLAVGGVAGCASWSHVMHLAAKHGQEGWLAWAVAACTETMALSGGLEVRRRRRVGQPVGAPVTVVVAATALQLAAQVAEASSGPWGVLLAAVPAVAFLVLVKLALSRHAVVEPVHAVVDEPVRVHAEVLTLDEPVHAVVEPVHAVVDEPVRMVDEPVHELLRAQVRRFDEPERLKRTDEELVAELHALGDERPTSLRGTARVLGIAPVRARRVLAMVGES